MSNLEEIRAQLRAGVDTQPASGNSILLLVVLAACGIAIGFAALWLIPGASSISPSSLLAAIRFWR